MAKYPIVSQREIPSPSGGFRASLSFPDAEGDLWEQIGNLAGKAQDLVLTTHLQQAEIQLQDAILQAETEENALADRIRANTDEDTYEAELETSISTMNGFMPKNPLAAQNYTDWMKRQTPEWRDSVNEAKRLRLKDKFEVTSDTLIADGRLGQLKGHLDSGVKTGFITQEKANADFNRAIHEAEVNAARQFAMRNPKGLLDAIGPEDKIEGFKTLTPGDVINLRAIAQGQQRFNETKYNQAQMAESQAIWDLSLRKETTMSQMVNAIDALQFHTPSEKDALLKSANSRMKLISEGMPDPLRTTQNLERKWELKQLAVDGNLTEKMARDAVNNGDITPNDYAELVNIIEDTMGGLRSSSQESLRTMKEMDGFFDDITDLHDAQDLRAAKIKARSLLEDRIRERKETNPLTGRELTEEMIRIQRQVERELEEGATEEELLPSARKAKPESLDKPLDMKKMARLLEARMKQILPTITNDEEWEALPKGTRFIGPDGKIRTK